jgi:hypothetical protein
MEPRPNREDNIIWFLTDGRGLKDDEISTNPNVGLTFVDGEEKVYLSITAKASVSRDIACARALWNKKQSGGADLKIQICSFYGLNQNGLRCGMGQRALQSRLSNLQRHALPALSQTLARSEKSPLT